MKLHEYIESNIENLRILVKNGMVAPVYLTHYQLYSVFINAKGLKSRNQRYYFTSDVCKVSLSTVMRAVKAMEQPITK